MMNISRNETQAPRTADQPNAPAARTPRQRLMALLEREPHTADTLAFQLGIPERRVEEHLSHIARSVARDHHAHLTIHPPRCRKCGFVFDRRTRVTCPSRCPSCRSEGIIPPQFSIERAGTP